MKTYQSLTIAALVALCGSTASAQSISWLSPVDGNWNDAARWDMGNTPNDLGEIAVLGLSGAYTVFTTNNWNIGGLVISNPDATLSIGTNQHSLYGDVMNDGTIVVNTTASTFNGNMFFAVDALLSGTGEVVLNGPAQTNDASISVGSGMVLTQTALHTIRGAGRLQGSIVNTGTVLADDPLGVGLELLGTLDQRGGGTAGADNGGALQLGALGVTIGGELFTTNGGTIFASGNNHRLDGVDVTGDLIIPGSGRTLILDSDIQNNGHFMLNPELSTFNATLTIDNSLTIGGTGTMTLASAGDYNDARLLCNASNVVTLGAGQTIQGSGVLDANSFGLIINQGTINANDPAQALGLAGAHMGDGGVYRADGGELNLRGNASVSNALFESSGAGRVELDISGTATVSNSTNTGTMLVRGNGGTLRIDGTITNNGVVQLNPENNVFNAKIETITGATIDGSGTIDMLATTQTLDAQLNTNMGATLTIGANQTVQGSGSIDGTGSVVINLGTINGNHAATMSDPIYPLELRGAHDGMGVGVYRSDDGFLLLGSAASVVNAIFDSSGAGAVGISHAGVSEIANCTNLGSFNLLGQGNTLRLLGDLTNNGIVRINSNANLFNSTIQARADVSINGTGTIRMAQISNFDDAQLDVFDPFNLTIGAGQTVAGSGRIEGGNTGTIFNNGTINGDDPAFELRLLGKHDGSGGGVYRSDDGVLGLGNGLELNGGAFESSGNGEIAKIDAGISNISDIVNNATMNLRGEGGVVEVAGSFTNNGSININSNLNLFNSTLRFIENTSVDGTGSINLTTAGNSDDAQLETGTGVSVTMGENQSITGDGQINGSFSILGSIELGGITRQLTTDDIALAGSSSIVFDLGGDAAPSFDRILVRNGHSIALDGTITINLDSGYAPSFGDTWDIIDGATTGTFDETITGVAPIGQVYRVIYESNRVYVILTCDADLSGDGVIDFFDVSTFLSYYSAQDVRGDLNNDGVFDFFDVSVFLQLFGQGCNP